MAGGRRGRLVPAAMRFPAGVIRPRSRDAVSDAAWIALRHSRRFDFMSSSAHSPKVLRPASASLAAFFAASGSMPLASSERHSVARSRASARVTAAAEPNPASRCFPAKENIKVHRLETAAPLREIVR